MKLICLNTWGCRVTEPILQFIKEHSVNTDFFVLQEIINGGEGRARKGELKNAFAIIGDTLNDFSGFFSEYDKDLYYSDKNADVDYKYGIATFVSKKHKSSILDEVCLLDKSKVWSDFSGQFAAGAATAVESAGYNIINIHGLWQESIKADTEAKIEQSKKILDLAHKSTEKTIICGDFNMLPDTQSIKMIADEYTDLIKKYNITDTRGNLYPRKLRYADFVFMDKNIQVKSFEVPNVAISDHLPLIVEFD